MASAAEKLYNGWRGSAAWKWVGKDACERGGAVSVSPPELEPLLSPVTADEALIEASESVEAAFPPAAEPPHRARRRRWPLILLLVLVAVGAPAGYWGWSRLAAPKDSGSIQLFTVARRSFPVTLNERGELKAARSLDIRCELEGRSTIISLVEEGTQAKKGDLLVELASDEIVEKIRDAEIREATALAAYEAAVKELEILQDENASKIRKAELDLRLAELALEKYREGEAVELRQDATLDKEKADYVYRRTRDTLKDSEELHEQGFLTRIELDNDRFAHYEAGLNVKKADLGNQVIEKYTIPMALQEKESNVTEARKELERTRKAALASEAKATADRAAKKSELELIQEKLAKYRDQKVKSRIYAPADGLVVYARSQSWYRSETLIEKGAQVIERQSLIELPDTSSMKARIQVHEAQMERLRVGLPATVDIEGFSGQQFRGSVSRIAVLADSQNRYLNPNLKQYETEILLEGEFEKLKPGLTARVEILVAELTDVLAVPVQAVFAKAGRYYVFVERGGRTDPVPVEPGMSSNEFVEIRAGLDAGDRVYLAVTEQMKLLLPDEDAEGRRARHGG